MTHSIFVTAWITKEKVYLLVLTNQEPLRVEYEPLHVQRLAG